MQNDLVNSSAEFSSFEQNLSVGYKNQSRTMVLGYGYSFDGANSKFHCSIRIGRLSRQYILLVLLQL